MWRENEAINNIIVFISHSCSVHAATLFFCPYSLLVLFHKLLALIQSLTEMAVDFSNHNSLLLQAVTCPAVDVSHIMLEAYKKFILVSLILHGKVRLPSTLL